MYIYIYIHCRAFLVIFLKMLKQDGITDLKKSFEF